MSDAGIDEDLDRWRQQMRKGSSRLAILQLLRERERYGYDVVQTLRTRTGGALDLPEGNVYPVLHALEREGLVQAQWRDVERGTPARKYYSLTPRGASLYSGIVEAWTEHVRAVAALLKGEEKT